jgi:hypothetical protein
LKIDPLLLPGEQSLSFTILERSNEMDQMMVAQKASEWLSMRLQVPSRRAECLGQEFATYLSTAATAPDWEGFCLYCGEPARGGGSRLCWFHYTAALLPDAEKSVDRVFAV